MQILKCISLSCVVLVMNLSDARGAQKTKHEMHAKKCKGVVSPHLLEYGTIDCVKKDKKSGIELHFGIPKIGKVKIPINNTTANVWKYGVDYYGYTQNAILDAVLSSHRNAGEKTAQSFLDKCKNLNQLACKVGVGMNVTGCRVRKQNQWEIHLKAHAPGSSQYQYNEVELCTFNAYAE